MVGTPTQQSMQVRFAEYELSKRGLAPLAKADDDLHDMAARRSQLVDACHAERCRAGTDAVRRSIDAVLVLRTQQFDVIDRTITAHIKASPALARVSANLQSFTGCSPIVTSR